MRSFFAWCVASIGLLAGPAAWGADKPTTVATTQEAPWVTLWNGKAPGALGEEKADTPALQIYASPKPTGAAIVVCPGGGYGGLAPHEGGKVGQWLAENGIHAFVLRYRLGPKYHYPVEIGDGQRAIRYVRAHATEYGVDPKRIGIIGFSAGGHLCSSVATHFDAGNPNSEDPVEHVSSRPDLHIVVYPVISMAGSDTHAGSRRNLFGPEPDAALLEKFSNQTQVTKETPPAFIVHSSTDKVVPVSNSDAYADAFKQAGVPYEYVRLDHGAHGYGLIDDWTHACLTWLRFHKF